jgi:hypothetical protein
MGLFYRRGTEFRIALDAALLRYTDWSLPDAGRIILRIGPLFIPRCNMRNGEKRTQRNRHLLFTSCPERTIFAAKDTEVTLEGYTKTDTQTYGRDL